MSLANSKTQRVYIVEDDDSVRRALGRLVDSECMDFETFASGEAFLASLPPDADGCVILDIRMSGLTGHDVQEALRSRGHKIPVIALSAQADEESHRRACELGAVAFFRKPVDDHALLDTIRWAMRGRREDKCPRPC